jgi:hypothetical protein
MRAAAAHQCQLLDIGDASNRAAGSSSNEGVNTVMGALRSGPPTAIASGENPFEKVELGTGTQLGSSR